MPRGIHENIDATERYWIIVALKALYLLGFRHKKRRPWTPSFDNLVEPGGFEPPSASTPLSVLHA